MDKSTTYPRTNKGQWADAARATNTGNGTRLLRSKYLLYLLAFVVALALWQFIAVVLVNSELILPTPRDVFDALIDALSGPFWGDASVYYHAFRTGWVTVAGFMLGAGAGVALGVLMAQSRTLMVALNPYITALQSLPRIAIAPIIIIWFGQGFSALVIITASIAFLPVLVSTITGLTSVDRGMIDMLRGLSATRMQILRKVTFRAALPHIFSGLQVAIIFSVVGAIVAEWVGANEGLGVLLLLSQYSMDVPRSFALLVVLAVLGMLFNGAVSLARKKVLFWQSSEDTEGKRGIAI